MRRRSSLLLAVLVAAAAVASVAGASTKDVRLSLVAYSTPREAYAKLIPEFQKTPAGNGVSFSQSYGASGDQARAVKAGLKADIVALSLAPDVDELVKAGLVDAKWKQAVVQGDGHQLGRRLRRPRRQPEEDQELERPAPARASQVVTPNPFTSGGARWNVMAAYGAWRKLGQDRQAGPGEPAEAVQERRLAGQERP